MLTDALEFIAQKNGNVVRYDTDGNPSIYVPFKKCLSSDLNAGLPAHVHPAFKVGSEELDEVLIGKYMGCKIPGSNAQYSIPGRAPRVNAHYDTMLTEMRAFDANSSGLTIADHGLILLTALKMGWQPKGNNNYGADYRDGTKFELNKAVNVGDMRVFKGWAYKAKVAHTTSADHLPENDRAYWEKGEHVGGVPVASQVTTTDINGLNTLTGSGPLSWCLGGDPANLVDIQGNASEQVYGYRTVDGEIQILPNNDAASPAADLSASSSLWKAIKPGATEADYTLVTPGTAGTLHWNWLNSNVTLDTVSIQDSESRGTAFTGLAVNSTNVPVIPCILRELGLFPCTGDNVTQGTFYVNLSGERVARRGGAYGGTSDAGLGCLYGHYPRSYALVSFGARPRSL